MKSKKILDLLLGCFVLATTLLFLFYLIKPYYLKVSAVVVKFITNTDVTINDQTIRKNTYINKPNDLSKKGYRFDNWYLKDSETIWDFEENIVTENITLDARWTLSTYTITFETNGGSYIPNQEIIFEDLITYPEPPILEYNIFIGWYGDKEFNIPFDFTQKVTYDMTIYAKWQFDVKYLKFSKLENSITIKGLISSATPTIIYLPDIIEGYKVIKIADYAFENTDLIYFYGNESLQILGEGVFYDCKNLLQINLKNNLISIGQFCFSGCISLLNFTMPDKLDKLAPYVFNNCISLAVFTASTSLSLIDRGAFKNCINLRMLTIFEAIEKIEDFAFSDCKNLESFIISSNINYIGDFVFENWEKNQTINIIGPASRCNNWGKYWNGNCEAAIKIL